MDEPLDDRTKHSKSEKEKHHILYGIMILHCNLNMTQTNFFMKQKQTQRQKTNLWLVNKGE